MDLGENISEVKTDTKICNKLLYIVVEPLSIFCYLPLTVVKNTV